jgi:hypothetical protein
VRRQDLALKFFYELLSSCYHALYGKDIMVIFIVSSITDIDDFVTDLMFFWMQPCKPARNAQKF